MTVKDSLGSWLVGNDEKGYELKNTSDCNKLPDTTTSHFAQTGFLRLASILAPNGPIPVGRSTWWAGIKSGRFPKPVKLGPRTTAWRVEDIRALIEKGVA